MLYRAFTVFVANAKWSLKWFKCWGGGTAAAAPPPFRPSDPALCGSCPLVNPYYCRLADLLCLFVYPLFVYYFVCVCICVFCVFLCFLWVVWLYSFLLQYFDTVGWVYWPVKTVGRLTYFVLVQMLNHGQSINSISVSGVADVLQYASISLIKLQTKTTPPIHHCVATTKSHTIGAVNMLHLSQCLVTSSNASLF